METIGINTHTGNTHADVSWSFQDRYIKQVRYKPLQLFNHLGLHNLSVIQHSDNSLLFMICLFPLRHDGRLYVPFFFSSSSSPPGVFCILARTSEIHYCLIVLSISFKSYIYTYSRALPLSPNNFYILSAVLQLAEVPN